MSSRFAALALSAALCLCAFAAPAKAETILDQLIADPSSITVRDFRKLAPQGFSTAPFDYPYSEAWGTSAGGTYVVGATSATDEACEALTGSSYLCDYSLIAAVWTPGTGTGTDQPTLLPFAQDLSDAFYVYSEARAINADGTTIVGRSEVGFGCGECAGDFVVFDPLAWTRVGDDWQAFVLAPDPLFTIVSTAAGGARGISDDGQNAVGWTGDFDFDFFSLTEVQASLWTRTGAGYDDWTPALRLGVLTDTTTSVANGVAVDADGDRIVVGWSGTVTCDCSTIDYVAYGSDDPVNVFLSALFGDDVWFPQAVYWTVAPDAGSADEPVALTPLADGYPSDATAISADASTIVGWSGLEVFSEVEPFFQAVRWTRTDGGYSSPTTIGLFSTPQVVQTARPDSFAIGSAALAVSEDGNAVGGYQVYYDGAQDIFTLGFIWTSDFANNQSRYVGEVLDAIGVSTGNWVFYNVTGIRSMQDSFVLVGTGCASGELNPNSCEHADPGYIVRLAREDLPDNGGNGGNGGNGNGNGNGNGGGNGNGNGESGITTPGQQIASFGEISVAALAVGSSVGATLAGLNDTAENHRCIRPQDGPIGNWCFFTFGTANLFSGAGELDGNQFTGEVGIAHYFTPVTSIAASVGGGVTDSDTYLGGSYRASEVHVGGYVAHIPDQGFRAFFGGVWGDLTDIDLTRGYLNGIGLARSSGNTDGEAWGLLGRLGYGFRAGPATLVTPFVEVSFTESSFTGYSESGGPFPTTFQGIETNTTTGRLGVLHEQDLSETLRVYLQAAWAHVLDSETPTVRGAVLDIFEFTAHGHGGLDGWAEFMAGARSQVSERGVVSVTGRIATEFDDFFSMGGRLGYSHIF